MTGALVRSFLYLSLTLVARVSAVEGFLLPRAEPLLPCAIHLEGPDSAYRRGLIRRFGMYTVTDGERLGHHEFTREAADPRVDPVRVPLLDLTHGESRWRRERWQAPPLVGPYWLYEAGFRDLEEDARRMNAVVAGVLLGADVARADFFSSDGRVRELERLNTFRWGCHDRVMKRYREHRNKQKYLGELDFANFVKANRLNLNVDVFALTTTPLDWCAERTSVRDAVISTIQISYDQPLDFLRPTLDGLLAAHNEAPTTPHRLPFMERLDPAVAEDFIASFNRSYGHLATCEITRYINVRTPAIVVARLLLEVLERLHERGCQVIVASVDPHSLRRFRRYGFERDRRLPTLGSAEESLAVLRVQSVTFAETLMKLRRESSALEVTAP